MTSAQWCICGHATSDHRGDGVCAFPACTCKAVTIKEMMDYNRAVKNLKAEGLSTRTASALAYSGDIKSLHDLQRRFLDLKQILLIKGIGEKAFAEILVTIAMKEMICWHAEPVRALGFEYGR